jgi:hypothetical protein
MAETATDARSAVRTTPTTATDATAPTPTPTNGATGRPAE